MFDPSGTLWFTGQAGVYGRLTLPDGTVEAFAAFRRPRSVRNHRNAPGRRLLRAARRQHIGRIDPTTTQATLLGPLTPGQARAVWSDSRGRIWSSQWSAGQVAVYDPATNGWQEWRLPGERPQAYAVFVDDRDVVWLSDFGANALVRFDPASQAFSSLPLPSDPSDVRQIHGRPGEVWGAASAADKLIVFRT